MPESEIIKAIETTRQTAATRQIDAAIHHFKNGEYECAITLAAAAEGMLPTTEHPHVFTLMKDSPNFKEADFNCFINWLKHPNEPDQTLIPDFEVVMVIIRAISKMIATYETGSNDMKEFCRWAFAQGHIPMPKNTDFTPR